MAGRFEARVEFGLQALPHAVAVRAQDHTAAHRSERNQFGLVADRLIPLGKILGFGRNFTDEFRFGHTTRAVPAFERAVLGDPLV